MYKHVIKVALVVVLGLFGASTAWARGGPTISSIITGPSQTTVTVKWTTDIAADSKLEYDTTPTGFTFSKRNSTLVRSHSVTMTGLSPNTTYYYHVVSGASGSYATSTTATFTTTSASSRPSVSVSGSKKTVTKGASVTLTWSSTGATTCLASGAWGGSKATSGSQSVTVSTSSTYMLGCHNSSGTTTKSVAVYAAVPTLSAPQGSLDEVRTTDGIARGWSYDADASTTANMVKLFIGAAGSGGTLIGTLNTTQARTDVNSAFTITGSHGFWFTIPNAYRDNVSHSLYAYGTDLGNPNSLTLLSGAPISFTLAPLPSLVTQLPSVCTVGVNLAGAENGVYTNNYTPTYGTNYTYPSTNELDYFRKKGVTLIRLPIQWEVIQPTLGAALSSSEVTRLTNTLNAANARGMSVIIDVHNMARYQGAVISTTTSPTVSEFADFWSRMATQFNGQAGIYAYDIMNEPHDMPNPTTWPTAAQAAVDAIRAVDTSTIIMVEGDNYASASNWRTDNENLSITDSANKLVYQAHQYFDFDGSGTYVNSYDGEYAYPDVGVDRLRPFVTWLKDKGARGFIGEFSVPDSDPRWLDVLNRFIKSMRQNGLSGTYWSAGDFSKYLSFSLEPYFGADRAQMPIISHYDLSPNSCSTN